MRIWSKMILISLLVDGCVIGRWNVVDKYAEVCVAISSYQYAANNPIKVIDAPNGVNSFSIDHNWDMLSGNDMGNNTSFRTSTEAGSPGVSHQNKTFVTEIGTFIKAYQKSKGDNSKLISDSINQMRSFGIKVTVN